MTFDEAVKMTERYFSARQGMADGSFKAKDILTSGGLKGTMLQAKGARMVMDQPDEAIDRARNDPDIFDALRFGAGQWMMLEQTLPPQINRWVASYLFGGLARPTGKEGRPNSLGMELEVFGAVRRLQEAGLSPTRNDATPAISGCDAVARALKNLDLSPTSYERVKQIYLKVRTHRGPDGGVRLPSGR